MNRLAITLCLATLAGCGLPEASPAMVGEVSFAGQTYPIFATADGAWRIMVEGMPVNCLRPAVGDCYWSLRSHLNAQAALDFGP